MLLCAIAALLAWSPPISSVEIGIELTGFDRPDHPVSEAYLFPGQLLHVDLHVVGMVASKSYRVVLDEELGWHGAFLWADVSPQVRSNVPSTNVPSNV